MTARIVEEKASVRTADADVHAELVMARSASFVSTVGVHTIAKSVMAQASARMDGRNITAKSVVAEASAHMVIESMPATIVANYPSVSTASIYTFVKNAKATHEFVAS